MSIVSESQGSAVKVAHFDCFSGISGDMVLGAVIDAGVPVDAIRAALDSLGLPIKLEVERVIRCGFAATKATIEAADQEDYRFLPDVEAIIAKGALTPKQRELATAIFRKLAEAEAAVHGMPLERVHFHEVGALDSIADIVGAAVGLDLLGVERFTSSPVPTGTGTVKAAHGIMPVPTPGTLELLKGVPLAPSKVEFELTTPTGAAILTTVVSEYTATPAMTVERVGHGAGTKDFLDRPNILRLMVGTRSLDRSATHRSRSRHGRRPGNQPRRRGPGGHRLLHRAAVRGRGARCVRRSGADEEGPAGVLLSVICEPAKAAELEAILFRETAHVRHPPSHRRAHEARSARRSRSRRRGGR